MQIGKRIKENYENRYRIKLTRRTPVIIRLDGKAFHTLTRGCEKPFDINFQNTMISTAENLCIEIQGAKCAYVQSDEISILLTDFDSLTTDAWFDYNLQKIVSVSAALASTLFTRRWNTYVNVLFDSRAFNIPKAEVCNYFIWRQIDWFKNSLQMLSREYYSHKELHKKKSSDMHEMLNLKGVNWTYLSPIWKNGTFIRKEESGFTHSHMIIFTKDRNAIERYLEDGT